jgi:hypothetical protein
MIIYLLIKEFPMIKIKGSVLLDAVKWARQKFGDEQIDRIISLMDAEAKSIFLGQIMRSDWYPVEAFVNYIEIELQEIFGRNTESLIELTGEPVAKQLRGIYALFVKLGSPEFLIKRLSVVTDTYFKGIEVKPTMVTPGKATVQYIGFEKQHAVIQFVIIGFYKKALEISGAKNVKIRFTTPIGEGKGYSELTVSWDPT